MDARVMQYGAAQVRSRQAWAAGGERVDRRAAQRLASTIAVFVPAASRNGAASRWLWYRRLAPWPTCPCSPDLLLTCASSPLSTLPAAQLLPSPPPPRTRLRRAWRVPSCWSRRCGRAALTAMAS